MNLRESEFGERFGSHRDVDEPTPPRRDPGAGGSGVSDPPRYGGGGDGDAGGPGNPVLYEWFERKLPDLASLFEELDGLAHSRVRDPNRVVNIARRFRQVGDEIGGCAE